MKEFEGKRLLVLGGADIHSKVVETANDMGVFTIVTDYNYDSSAKKIACQSLMIDATDIESIVDWCRENPVDGVLSFGIDPLQIPYQKICNRLNLPCYASQKQFEIMTNKMEFKKFCSSCEVGTIPDYTVDDIYSDNVIYPILVKPNECRGSRGQSICYIKSEAIKAVDIARKNSNDNNVLCEKYMRDYYDVSNAFFVINGEPYLVKFGDRYLGKSDDNLDRQAMCTRLPSIHATSFVENSLEKVKKMIRKLGIKYGPVFLQGFLDKKGNIYYYDPGLRMPGSDYERILKEATGFDIVKSLVHFALSGDINFAYGSPKDCYKLNGQKAYILDVSVRPGIIKSIYYSNELKKDNQVIYYSQRAGENAIIPESGDIQQRVAEFSVLMSNGDSINDSINNIYSNYHVYDIDNKDMIVSKVQNIL